ncbi:4-hydroxy-tetrahydrodipicolinate reductase [Halospeciosus flavus]|uniref:4-hydroxy-tetrahydrodipicolinate reductase n=1 Tax=Halospeciosus flavus TaxID=3032283 RepID=A0ABD5Z4Z1_9EURY|nr:4-hydroxy-tetrahydrodipicolinate reductase [Halospeciosus flavus]
MSLRVGVTGAEGRMGREILQAAADRDVDVAFAVNRSPGDTRVAGVEVEDAADFEELVGERDVDVVVDFTGPESSVRYAAACAATDVPIVVGTTGFDEADVSSLREAGEAVPILLGANFSRGVQALLDAVESAVGNLPSYDVEVTETHHNQKRDAPSGTAKVILDRIVETRDDEETEYVHGREGDQPREAGEIGVHARRAGDVTGEHEVLLAGNHEVLELTHRAGDRGVFAAGALDAAAWAANADAGFYRFEEVASEL